MTHRVLGLAALLGLLLSFGAVVEAHGVPATPPAPAAAPAPAPGPSPGPGPAPGATPGPGPSGGITPGPAGGGSTPGVGGRGGATGGRPGYGGLRKPKFSSDQTYWLGAIETPWEAAFLPVDAREGYAGSELSLDDAVAGQGGSSAWKLEKMPTLVAVYDPSKRAHMRVMGDLDKDRDFKAASPFFNLERIDVRTVKDDAFKKSYSKDVTLVVYRANGERAGEVTMSTRRSVDSLMKIFDEVFSQDHGMDRVDAVSQMGRILAREAWVKDAVKRYEAVVICPDCGAPREEHQTELRKFQKELRELKASKDGLTKVRAGVAAR